MPVAAGSPELVGLLVLPVCDEELPVCDEEPPVEVSEAPVEMGVSPAGMDMTPVTVEREGSVMMEAMDSEMGWGKGTGVPKLALGVLEHGEGGQGSIKHSSKQAHGSSAGTDVWIVKTPSLVGVGLAEGDVVEASCATATLARSSRTVEVEMEVDASMAATISKYDAVEVVWLRLQEKGDVHDAAVAAAAVGGIRRARLSLPR